MSKALNKIGYAVPFTMIGTLLAIYLLSPEFYLAYVLEESTREQGAVEIVTFLSSFVGGLMLVASTWILWKRGNWPAAGVVGAVAAATLLFAGEEIGWGQIHLGWETPVWWKENFGGSTDLHSSTFPVRQSAAVFLFVIFFLLPLVWKLRSPVRLPGALEPAIAEGPVIFTIAFAAIYRELKGVYFWLHPDGFRNRFYEEFFWGLNEHKEMLIAVAMLMYALYRLPLFKQVIHRL